MKLCVIEGDGIGHEVIPAAVQVLQAARPDVEIIRADAGWDCFLQCGTSVPDTTLSAIRECGAALFGAVSSPSRKVPGYRSAILTMRQALDLYANLRPVRSLPQVSPRPGIDLLVVRENTEGMYAGRERLENEHDPEAQTAIAERVITRRASQRLAERTLALMQQLGRRKLTIVHKANVLPLTDGLFRDTVRQVIEQGSPSSAPVEIDELLVDIAALKMVAEPERYDVIITTNLFGDILSDEASYWMGGMGLAPSINWGASAALAEPVHGSAPDIAGKGIANPIAAILSAALLVRYAWNDAQTASRIENAVSSALAKDLVIENGRVSTENTTAGITQAVLARLE